MRKNRLITLITSLTMAAAGLAAVSAGVPSKKADSVSATDYSSTIRVYFKNPSGWGTISNVKLGSYSAISSSSSDKYDSQYGEWVYDIPSSSTYGKLYIEFKENGTQWRYAYDDGYAWRDSGWGPGHQYKIENVRFVSVGTPKLFDCDKTWISTIPDDPIHSYTITLNDNGGTGGSGSVTATSGVAMPSVTPPTRANRIFDGYYDAETGGTKYIKADGTSAKNFDKSSDCTLYAHWNDNYNVSDGFYFWDTSNDTLTAMHGITGGQEASVAMVKDHTYKITRIASKARVEYVGYSGHVLTGANTAFAHSQLQAASSNDDIECLVSDTYTIKLWYEWDNISGANKIEVPARFQVTWDSNGGSAVDNPSYRVDYGALLGNQESEKDNFTLAGWNSGQTDNWDFATWQVVSDTTLTAVWSANSSTVTLVKGNGQTDEEINCTYGSAMPSITPPTKTNRSFDGYYDAETGGTKYINADGTSAKNFDKSGDCTFYAHWVDNYNVSDGFYVWDTSNDTLTAMNSITGGQEASVAMVQNHTYKITRIASKARAEYVGYSGHVLTDANTAFAHSQLQAASSNDDIECLVTDTYTVKLWYEWDHVSAANKIEVPARYQVTWDSNGGSEVANPSYRVDHGSKLTYQSSTKDDYTLAGWNSGQTDNWNFDTWEVVGNTTLTAVWEASVHIYSLQVKTGDQVSASYTLIQNPNNLNEYMTENEISLTADQVLAAFDNSSLLTMNAKSESNNNCENKNGATTVVVSKSGRVYIDIVNNTIFCDGFVDDSFYMVVTDSNSIDYVLLKHNETPQSDCVEYLTEGEYAFTKNDVISYINTGSSEGNIVPFDVATVDEASLNANFATSGGKIACTETTNSFAYLKLAKEAHRGENSVYFGNLDVLDAINYAKDFISTMGSVCAAPKGEDDWNYPWSDDIGDKWEIMAGKFDELVSEDESAAGMLTDATTSSSYKEIAHFAAFYDYVYSKYHSSHSVIDDFADRFVENGAGVDYFSSSSKLISVSDVSTSTWIIAAVAVVGIAAVGVFFIYRKRKEI